MPLIFIEKNTSLIEVRAATFPIGTLSLVTRSLAAAPRLMSVQYRWHLTISAAPPDFKRDGHEYTVEDAKVAIEKAWQMWLAAAGLIEK